MLTYTELDNLIASRSLLLHPFYVRWTKGELTMDHMKVYAKEYFKLVERIPGIVARVRDRVTDTDFQAQIAVNVVEEQEHVDLWKRFAKSVGVSEAELAAHTASPKTEAAIQALEQICEKAPEQGVVAMYALELELPKIAETKKDGLCKFYGLTSEDAHIYFDEHLKEEKHIAVWRSQKLGATSEAAANVSLTAQNHVLDAVCEACNLPLSC
jgi:pyrroloquinoline-quinone synthase